MEAPHHHKLKFMLKPTEGFVELGCLKNRSVSLDLLFLSKIRGTRAFDPAIALSYPVLDYALINKLRLRFLLESFV